MYLVMANHILEVCQTSKLKANEKILLLNLIQSYSFIQTHDLKSIKTLYKI